jgi:hypothetical protein
MLTFRPATSSVRATTLRATSCPTFCVACSAVSVLLASLTTRPRLAETSSRPLLTALVCSLAHSHLISRLTEAWSNSLSNRNSAGPCMCLYAYCFPCCAVATTRTYYDTSNCCFNCLCLSIPLARNIVREGLCHCVPDVCADVGQDTTSRESVSRTCAAASAAVPAPSSRWLLRFISAAL